jgi:hypothetical protein
MKLNQVECCASATATNAMNDNLNNNSDVFD